MEEINNFQQEPDESLFRAWERFKELLMKYPRYYLTNMQEVILFYNGLDVPTRQILDSKGAIPSKTAADAKIAIQEITEYSQKWHNGTSSRARMYAAQGGCELKQVTQTKQKDCPQKEKGKTLEEAYYTQFGAPYQLGGQYIAARPGFYQRNNGNSSYLDRRTNLEESLTKFMAESAKRHEENSNIINGIRASTDATIRNQGASIKTLEIQIGQMSKVLQERGFGSLPSSTETNPRDQVKSISTTKADFFGIHQIGCGPYAREAQDVKILDAYDHTLPQKEKDPRSFTLPYFIHNIYFDKALVDLGARVSVMPFSTYTKLGLGILSHTSFIILDIPEDDDVPLILRRPFLSTAHSKIDVFKRKITLRYKYVIDDLLPSVPINLLSKSFYYSIIRDKDKRESHARTLIDIPVFVRSFSIILGFTIIDDNDMTKDVVLRIRFCKKNASCQRIMKKFALGVN
ncbi:hypothetical protein Tco_0857868 [Tanacetum coccineum]|uniref:Uncharacterized protein n=1 Tax=Tanacetum coccineum TaxID=301880 RepID=A0ABQ5B8C6_9ASTR